MENWQYYVTRQQEQSARKTGAPGRQSGSDPHHERNMDLAQIRLLVSDLKGMTAFYAQALAIPAETVRSNQSGQEACCFYLPSGSFMLTRAATEEGASSHEGTLRAQQLVFCAGDEAGVDEVYHRVRELPGCTVLSVPRFDRDNRYVFTMEDPEGNTVIFRE